MKLRIKENSLRLRLTQTEVELLHKNNFYEQLTKFGADRTEHLTYRVEITKTPEINAFFEDKAITVLIPKETGIVWATSDQVTLEHYKYLGPGEELRILIEKDFQCLKPRPDEDESDHFPHPEASKHL